MLHQPNDGMQAPGYSDEEVDHLVQSNAILRHLGRK